MLEQIGLRVEARNFIAAAELIAGVKEGELYRSNKDFREEVADLQSRVERAEQEAARLYEKATEAYEDDDTEELQELLQELKNRYRNTRTFAEHL